MFRNKFYSNLVAYAQRADDKTCETPDHWEGECVELNECPALLTLSEKANKSANEKTFLRESFCNRPHSDLHVYCRFETIDILPDSRYCGQSRQYPMYGGSTTYIDEYPWTVLITFTKCKFK